jgi:hypothetical protein
MAESNGMRIMRVFPRRTNATPISVDLLNGAGTRILEHGRELLGGGRNNAMTGKEIIEKYLKENGFDGFCGNGCGCTHGDLMPCEYGGKDCVPAFLYRPIKNAETNCLDFKKCEVLYNGCLYQGDFDDILSEENRQCTCRYKPESGE